MRAAQDGVKEPVGSLTYHEEHRHCRRFFYQLEQFVGTFQVHSLGQPDDAHLIAALARLERHLSQQTVALAHTHQCLLVGGTHAFEPLVHREVGTLHDHGIPLTGEVVALHLMVAVGAGRTYHGIREVQVGMLPFGQHSLGIAPLRFVARQQIRSESHRHSHLPTTFRAGEEEGMWQPLLVGHLHQTGYRLLLSYHFFEVHFLMLVAECLENRAQSYEKRAKYKRNL